MSHFIEYCKLCHEVISQCRCPSINKEERWGICGECREAIGEGNALEDECQIGDIIESRNGNLFLIISNSEMVALGNKLFNRREYNDRVTAKRGMSVCRKVGNVKLNKYIDGQEVQG